LTNAYVNFGLFLHFDKHGAGVVSYPSELRKRVCRNSKPGILAFLFGSRHKQGGVLHCLIATNDSSSNQDRFFADDWDIKWSTNESVKIWLMIRWDYRTAGEIMVDFGPTTI
jgi:hypothetical protein